MNILKKILGKKEVVPEWDETLRKGMAYPEASISLVTVQTKTGIGTGWIDKAYSNYPYKANCRYNIQIGINLTDDIVQNNSDLDMHTIEDFLIDGLQQTTVAHVISRLVDDSVMTMEFYVENKDASEAFLNAASDNPNKLFSFSYKVNEDPMWLAVRPLLKIN